MPLVAPHIGKLRRFRTKYSDSVPFDSSHGDWRPLIALTMARHAFSHDWQCSAHSFRSGLSKRAHSAPQVLHASAHAAQENTMSGLSLHMRSKESMQNLAQSAASRKTFACSVFP